jgi:uncharacterized damage-inducible protein DinB
MAVVTLHSYLERLYTYNRWANDTLIPFIHLQGADQNPEIMKMLSHLLNAQEIWISRIQGREMKIKGVWEVYGLEECQILAQQTASDWLNFIEGMVDADYTRIISYKNTLGNYYETPIIDIMCHCVNHATYHRAQVTKLMRQIGKEVINTDFITYARAFSLPELNA